MGSGSRGLAAEWARLVSSGPGSAWFVSLGAVLGALLAPQLLFFVWQTTVPSRTSQVPGYVDGFVEVGFGIRPPVLSLAAVMAAFALFGACTVWLGWTDVRERRLPNPVLAFATVGLLVPLALVSLVWGSHTRLGWSIAATAALTGVTLLAWWCVPGTVGGGDVKLIPAAVFLAAWVHPVAGPVVFVLLVCGALAISGTIALARRRASVPLGPILLGASWVAAVAGAQFESVTWV